MLIPVPDSTFNVSVDFIRWFGFYKLFGSCEQPLSRPPGESTKGEEEKRIKGGREVAWT